MTQPPVPPPGRPPAPPPPPPVGDPAWPGGGRRYGTRAADAFPVPFSVVDGIVLVLWTIGAQLFVVLPAVILGIVDENSGPTMLLLVVVSQVLGLGGGLGYLAARERLSWRLLGPRRPSGTLAAYGIVVGIGGFFLVNAIILLVTVLTGPVEAPEQQLLTDVTAGGASTLLAIVAAVVMAPILEEVAFRGVLFQALTRRVGMWPAAILSGLIFAAVHVEVTQPLYSFGLLALGVGLAWSLHRFGSLVVPIVGHAMFNAISVGLTLLGSRFLETA